MDLPVPGRPNPPSPFPRRGGGRGVRSDELLFAHLVERALEGSEGRLNLRVAVGGADDQAGGHRIDAVVDHGAAEDGGDVGGGAGDGAAVGAAPLPGDAVLRALAGLAEEDVEEGAEAVDAAVDFAAGEGVVHLAGEAGGGLVRLFVGLAGGDDRQGGGAGGGGERVGVEGAGVGDAAGGRVLRVEFDLVEDVGAAGDGAAGQAAGEDLGERTH